MDNNVDGDDDNDDDDLNGALYEINSSGSWWLPSILIHKYCQRHNGPEG